MENYFLEDIILGISKKHNTKCVYTYVPKFLINFLQKMRNVTFNITDDNKQKFLHKEILYDFQGVSKVFNLTDYIEGKDL